MSALHLRRGITATLLALTLTGAGLLSAPGAQANVRHSAGGSSSLGTTTVTTAPGIATTLLGKGILPLPTPGTGFGLTFNGGLAVFYGFPIVSSTANLATKTGDIVHTGGIKFVRLGKSLEIGNFDIDLAAGKIFATQVNFAPARIPVLDLDLTNLKVTTYGSCIVISGISLKLDPAAASALNATFGLALPTDGSLTFASASIRVPK